MFLIERISNKIGYKISNSLNLNEDQREVISYGAFNLLQMLWCIFWIILIGSIFNVLLEACIICFTIGLLRKYSGGVHSTSPSRCTIIGTFICIGFALIINKIFYLFNIYYIFLLGFLSLIISYYVVYKYAPVDSPSKPIRKIETRKRLKKSSILIINIFFGVIFILSIIYIKYKYKFLLNIIESIYIGILWQTFTLTPKGYNILNKIDYVLKKFYIGGK